MCYHVSLTATADDLARRFDAQLADGLAVPTYHHVAAFAHPDLPVITGHEPHTIRLFRWGLVSTD